MIITVESLRLYGYAAIWTTMVTGVILTRTWAEIDQNDTLLVSVYGYNNVCVNFDYPPSNYVLPVLWAVSLCIFLCYFKAQTVVFNTHEHEGRISPLVNTILHRMKAFEAVTFVGFSTIFAVSPEGPDHTMWIHTIPWLLMQIGLASCAASNTLHGYKSGMWLNLDHGTGWLSRLAVVYIGLLVTSTIILLVLTLNALIGMPTCVSRIDGSGWDDCEGGFITKTDGLAIFMQATSYLEFFLIAVIPPAKAGLLVWTRGGELERLLVKTALVHKDSTSVSPTASDNGLGALPSKRAFADATLRDYTDGIRQRSRANAVQLSTKTDPSADHDAVHSEPAPDSDERFGF